MTPSKKPVEQTWWTVAEGATYLRLSRKSIYLACQRRELRHARLRGGRTIRLKREWLDQWFEKFVEGGWAEWSVR